MQWIKRSDQEPEIKDDCSERYLAWDGQRVEIIHHGWQELDGSNVWVDAVSLPIAFTHWAFLPEPPTAYPEA